MGEWERRGREESEKRGKGDSEKRRKGDSEKRGIGGSGETIRESPGGDAEDIQNDNYTARAEDFSAVEEHSLEHPLCV